MSLLVGGSVANEGSVCGQGSKGVLSHSHSNGALAVCCPEACGADFSAAGLPPRLTLWLLLCVCHSAPSGCSCGCVGASTCCGQVVMLSILGFGAFTKPLLAAMLKGDAEAAALAAQLSKIPLLG